ncbi:MAG: signal recognition particle protein [Mycoplasmatales bacterium]|nr:signal recognition particle protein [Mycoplasmatales bacterium]
MLDFLGKRLQKSMAKVKSKRVLSEEDILRVTREIKMALLEADVNLIVVKQFIKSVKEKVIGSEIIGKLNPSQQMIKIVKDELVDVLGGKTKEVKISGNPSIIMMTGLQGSGKTTTSAKIVKYLTKKEGKTKPLLVAADVYRPAAIDQLIVLGKQLKIDVFSKGNNADPRDIVKEALKKAKTENYDLVIIDTAGRLSINEELMKELVDIKKIAKPHEILFVADALSGQDVINVASTFNERLSITGTVITKMDSDARGGAALSIRKLLNIPIKFIGTGEKISALDLFHPERMADRILGMGDVLSLIEKAEEVIDEKKSKKIMNRMMSGNFNLDDLMDQLTQMKKMGKMSKIIKLIPGMNGKISEDKLKSSESKLILYEILISSMTQEERRNPRLLKSASRKVRIIKGSGRSAQEYNALINEFERMSKQMKQMAKSMKEGSFNPSMLGGIK